MAASVTVLTSVCGCLSWGVFVWLWHPVCLAPQRSQTQTLPSPCSWESEQSGHFSFFLHVLQDRVARGSCVGGPPCVLNIQGYYIQSFLLTCALVNRTFPEPVHLTKSLHLLAGSPHPLVFLLISMAHGDAPSRSFSPFPGQSGQRLTSHCPPQSRHWGLLLFLWCLVLWHPLLGRPPAPPSDSSSSPDASGGGSLSAFLSQPFRIGVPPQTMQPSTLKSLVWGPQRPVLAPQSCLQSLASLWTLG